MFKEVVWKKDSKKTLRLSHKERELLFVLLLTFFHTFFFLKKNNNNNISH
jgi:hypothetical protein